MQRLKRRAGLVLGMTLLCLAAIQPARAELIVVEVTGRVSTVDALLAGTFAVDDVLTASYTFESTTAARAGSTSQFAVFDALKSLDFTINSYSASSTGAPEIQVDNDPPSPFVDRYGVVARASDGLSGPAVNGLALSFFGFRLDDSTNTVFSNALDLPTNLSLSSFTSTAFFVFFNDPASTTAPPQVLSGTIDSIRFRAVPEPGAITLMGLGVGAIGLVTLRRRRRA